MKVSRDRYICQSETSTEHGALTRTPFQCARGLAIVPPRLWRPVGDTIVPLDDARLLVTERHLFFLSWYDFRQH